MYPQNPETASPTFTSQRNKGRESSLVIPGSWCLVQDLAHVKRLLWTKLSGKWRQCIRRRNTIISGRVPANFQLSHKSKVSASIKRSTFSSRWRRTERWPDFRVNFEQPWIRSYFCHQAECGFGRLTQTSEEINEQNYVLILQLEGRGRRHEEKRRLRRETEAKSLETFPPKAADSGRQLTWAASTS